MAHGFTHHWKTSKSTILAFLLCAAGSTCLGGISSSNEHTMEMALSACQNRSGLIGPESAGYLQQLMNQNNFTTVWIGLKLENVYGSWRFLDNTTLANPKGYFDKTEEPYGCGTVDTEDMEFEDLNCLRSIYPALCKDCKTCTSPYSSEGQFCYQKDHDSNWFDAKRTCDGLGCTLADLKTKADIPTGTAGIFWTGAHNLKLQELQPVQDIFAHLSQNKYRIEDIQNNKGCLIAEMKTSLTWKLVPCAEKHPFICLPDTDQNPSTTFSLNWTYGYLGSEHDETSGSSGGYEVRMNALIWSVFIIARCA